MKQHSNRSSGLEILILVVVFMTFGCGAYALLSKKSAVEPTTQQATACKIINEEITDAAYKDWQTYTSEKGNVSFKYPALADASQNKLKDIEFVPYAQAKVGETYMQIQSDKITDEFGPNDAVFMYFVKGRKVPNLLNNSKDNKITYFDAKGIGIYKDTYTPVAVPDYSLTTYYMYRPCMDDTVVMNTYGESTSQPQEREIGIYNTLTLQAR